MSITDQATCTSFWECASNSFITCALSILLWKWVSILVIVNPQNAQQIQTYLCSHVKDRFKHFYLHYKFKCSNLYHLVQLVSTINSKHCYICTCMYWLSFCDIYWFSLLGPAWNGELYVFDWVEAAGFASSTPRSLVQKFTLPPLQGIIQISHTDTLG